MWPTAVEHGAIRLAIPHRRPCMLQAPSAQVENKISTHPRQRLSIVCLKTLHMTLPVCQPYTSRQKQWKQLNFLPNATQPHVKVGRCVNGSGVEVIGERARVVKNLSDFH